MRIIVRGEHAGDKIASFLMKTANQNSNLVFNSKERANKIAHLVIVSSDSTVQTTQSSRLIPGSNYINFRSETDLNKPIIYPNPLRNTINIKRPSNYTSDFNCEIVDIQGSTYHPGQIRVEQGGSAIQINISKFALRPRLYSLKMYSATKDEQLEFVVQ